ncbi:glycosyltransferase family 2 protein [Marinomonas posidonica]|uniref:Glycosyl transferase family 2 n=1 Tax=Marinomonas posidonica (strain CECT 7376 / NCIMB 14433 / IVIA-Po-181) TaxID=491952 RepID=F6CZQ0_MARPP|nr:glycosyltransferase family 2 protein [Marinomonas posidonica]AEF53561.1 glycosyl transferase family 2 [Marinomonas posidonica IVIA-Po-181]
MHKPDGVVVLYNPDSSVWANIASYIDYVGLLYVVDNSEQKNLLLIDKIKNHPSTVYIDNKSNLGIASALNRGAKEAISHRASWLLTMDQDSRFDEASLQTLVTFAYSLPEDHKIGVLSPVHKTINTAVPVVKGDILTIEVDSVMTSGNLIYLEAFQSVGGFLEKYFIDCVDHEYCLRLKVNGFKIILHKEIFLEHNLGDIEFISLFGKKVYYTNHSAMRRYYISRNRLDLIFRYGSRFPFFCFKELWKLLIEVLKVILFETDKFRKVFFTVKGGWHFFFNRFGQL